MTSEAKLDDIIDRAHYDTQTIAEQSIGLTTVVADGIAPPFAASVVGVAVEVVDAIVREAGMLEEPAVVCERDGSRYVVDVLDLEDWQEAEGAEYIAAYRRFCKYPPWGAPTGAPGRDRTDDDGDEEATPRLQFAAIERRLGLDEVPETFTFERLIDVFIDRSWDGDYYAPFPIDSKNYRHVPTETQNWFELLARMLDAAIGIAERRPEEGVEHLERLFRFYQRALPSGRVVFADELGSWMIPTDFQSIVNRYVELLATVDSVPDIQDAFEPVSRELSTSKCVAFLLDHGYRREAQRVARRAQGRGIDEVVDVLEAHGETELAEELAQK